MAKQLPISRDELLNLHNNERIPYLKQISINIPRQEEILNFLIECFEDNIGSKEPQTAIIEGLPRAGKTHIIDKFLKRYPAKITKTGKNIPIVYALVISPASPNNLLTALLIGIGDPRAGQGTIGNKIFRFQKYVDDCKTNMIILDEVHHFLHKGKNLIADDVANMFKVLIKMKNVSCVFVGKEKEVTKVVSANNELDSLFPDAITLDPFSWDEANPATIREYRSLLNSIEDLLPLREESNLYYKEMAWRIFVATGGSIGFTVRLIKSASLRVLKSGRESISLEDLSVGFTNKLAGERWGIKNPFSGDTPKYPAKNHIVNNEQHDGAGLRATNNRSQRKKEKSETISEVLNK